MGCRICMLVCANRHGGDMKASRIRIGDAESMVGHNIDVCVQCDEKACVESCPSEAISLDEKTGAVMVDEDLCVGCGDCVEACPYGAIEIIDDLALVCDLCGGEPGCVAGCPVDALTLEDE